MASGPAAMDEALRLMLAGLKGLYVELYGEEYGEQPPSRGRLTLVPEEVTEGGDDG